MKKYMVMCIGIFALVSCGGSTELSSDYFIEHYDRETLTLDLSDEGLDQIPVFSKYMTGSWLQDIYRIDLSDNDIQAIPAGVFDIFPNLSTVDLSSNDFKFGSDVKLSPTIKKLSLSDNSLENLDGFDGYPQLSKVDLTDNNLEDTDLGKLGGFQSLSELRVEGNNISEGLLQKINKINSTPIKQRAQ